MRLIFLATSLFTVSFFGPNKPPKYAPIEEHFALNWSTQMGSASFKTNLVITNGDLIIGSNGDGFMDYFITDKSSGVYRIDRKTGAVIKHFANESYGDMDVNGILLLNNRLYFGNDNEEFLCTSLDGKIIWRNPASGDIEHEPVLINNRGIQQIVYATETGEVKAVEPTTGKELWSYYIPYFEGWKAGDNRSIFKVKSYFTNTNSFYTKPVELDLNADGVMDLVYLTYDSKLYAINGASGKLLWLNEKYDRSEIVLMPTGTKNEPSLTFFTVTYDSVYNATNYLVTLNKFGKEISKSKMPKSNSGMGINFLALDNLFIVQRDSLLEINNEGQYKAYSRSNFYPTIDYLGKNVIEVRNGYESLISNRVFSYKGDPNCVIILNQQDHANYKNGFIEIFSLTEHKVIERFSLPMPSEFPPIIEDINKDGNLDLLINCYDGYLYCYDLKVKP
jgi:outer membrane protein assembly factor BamB